jgi:DNA-binding transcriptional LysR family regulator
LIYEATGLSNDRLYLISVFVAVVDANGFAGAARNLGVSPPAVTRAIAELENQLGVRLLIRTTRVVRVTEAGARYVEDCRRILLTLAEADEAIGGMHGHPKGKLILTAPVLFGSRFVTAIVSEYLQRYQDVSVSCMFLDRLVNMMDEGVDIAVRIGELPDSSMQAIQVGKIRRLICASPAYLERYGIPTSPDDLSEHSIISASGASTAIEWRLREAGKMRTIKLNARMATTTNDSAIVAAAAGLGLTRLMSYQAADQLRSGLLKTVLVEFEPEALPLNLLHREGRMASPKARAFLDLAIERMRNDPALS